MTPPPHESRHDSIEDLPLVTDSAEVTAVEPLDRSRNDAVESAAATALVGVGRGDLASRRRDGHPAIDWPGVRAFLDDTDRTGGTVRRLRALVERYDRPYPSLLRVAFRTREPFEFLPGQYLTVRFRDTPRPYSIASSPNADATELCIRRVPGGRLTSGLFEGLTPGDTVTVRGPSGDFVLDGPSSRDLAFLATGTGVAPLRSMIEYLFEEGWDVHDGRRRQVWLFLGASWEDDLAYRARFRELDRERENFHFVPTLTRERYLSDWDGETDYVQRVLMKYVDGDAVDRERLGSDLRRHLDRDPARGIDARIDPSNLEVYACGINAMVHGLERAARAIGVPERHIDGEGYG